MLKELGEVSLGWAEEHIFYSRVIKKWQRVWVNGHLKQYLGKTHIVCVPQNVHK